MSRATKVHATKTRQQNAATRQMKPGRPVNGMNLVPQHEASAKKAARKTVASRRVEA
jgi:hypothetical protein